MQVEVILEDKLEISQLSDIYFRKTMINRH